MASVLLDILSVALDTAFLLYIWRWLLAVHVPKDIKGTWAYWCVDVIFGCQLLGNVLDFVEIVSKGSI